MNNTQENVYVSPSFSSYSSDRLAEAAYRVSMERRSSATAAAADEGGAGDDEFQFVLVHDDGEVSVEDSFHDHQIRPVFPLFNRGLLLHDGGSNLPESSLAISLRRLFIEEDRELDFPPSCSSSEADRLEHIPLGTYCVWRPKMAEAPMPSQCRKSKSTGSASKRWNLRDLLRRCKSDGKDSFIFLTSKRSKEEKPVRSADPRPARPSASAHETFYVRNKAMKEEDRKKSYLPYKQGLVGFFANVNGLGKSFSQF